MLLSVAVLNPYWGLSDLGEGLQDRDARGYRAESRLNRRRDDRVEGRSEANGPSFASLPPSRLRRYGATSRDATARHPSPVFMSEEWWTRTAPVGTNCPLAGPDGGIARRRLNDPAQLITGTAPALVSEPLFPVTIPGMSAAAPSLRLLGGEEHHDTSRRQTPY